MKKIIIIVVALIVLVGGGFGGLFATDNLHLVGLGTAPEADKTVADEPKRETGGVFVALDQVTAPVIRGGVVAYNIYLNLQLEVDNASARNDVMAVLPRVRDEINMDLFSNKIIDQGGLENLDLKLLKGRLLKAVRRAAPKDTVRAVLIINVARGG